MSKVIFGTILLIFCLGSFCAAGNDAADSLELQEIYDQADTVSSHQILTSLYQGLSKSNDVQHDFWEGRFSLRIALHFGVVSGQPDSLFKYAERAKQAFTRAGDSLRMARSSMFLGIAEFQRGSEEKAMQWYLQSAQLYQSIGADSLLASLYINMGHSLKEINYPLYLSYLKKANALSRKFNEPRQEAITALGLTDAWIASEHHDSATLFLRRARLLADTLQDDQLLSYCFRNYALIAGSKNHVSTATRYYLEAIEIAPNARDRAIFYNQLGDLYHQNHRYAEAINYLKSAEVIAQEIGANQLLEPIYRSLGSAWEQVGNIEEALLVSQRYINLRDSIFSVRIRTEVAELTTKYEAERKEKENQKLRADNLHQTLQINALHRANQNRNLFIVLLFAILICGYIFYRNARKAQLQKNKIKDQEEMIRKQKFAELENEKNLVAIRSVVQGQESERNRLAKELHDGLGGLFTAIKLSLDQIVRHTERIGEHDALQRSKDLVVKAGREIRRIAQNLMPLSLARFGLVAALEDMIEELNVQPRVNISFQAFQIDVNPTSEIALAIYRIIQELLNNALKHAQATEVVVQLVQQDDELDIVVEDNGLGFDTRNLKAGSGLANIQSRLHYLGGSIEIESALGKGTSFNITCPTKGHSEKTKSLHVSSS